MQAPSWTCLPGQHRTLGCLIRVSQPADYYPVSGVRILTGVAQLKTARQQQGQILNHEPLRVVHLAQQSGVAIPPRTGHSDAESAGPERQHQTDASPPQLAGHGVWCLSTADSHQASLERLSVQLPPDLEESAGHGSPDPPAGGRSRVGSSVLRPASGTARCPPQPR